MEKKHEEKKWKLETQLKNKKKQKTCVMVTVAAGRQQYLCTYFIIGVMLLRLKIESTIHQKVGAQNAIYIMILAWRSNMHIPTRRRAYYQVICRMLVSSQKLEGIRTTKYWWKEETSWNKLDGNDGLWKWHQSKYKIHDLQARPLVLVLFWQRELVKLASIKIEYLGNK